MAGGAGIQRQMVQGGTRDIQESALSQGAAHHSVSQDRSNHRRGKTSEQIKYIQMISDTVQTMRQVHLRITIPNDGWVHA